MAKQTKLLSPPKLGLDIFFGSRLDHVQKNSFLSTSFDPKSVSGLCSPMAWKGYMTHGSPAPLKCCTLGADAYKVYQILSTCRLWAQAHIPNHPKSSQNPNITSCLTGICAGAMEATANDFWARLALKLFGAMLNRLALLFLWGTEGDIFLKELSILVSRLVRGCCKSSQNCPIHTSTKLLIMPYRTVELCFIL